jgi:hypothetical protein
MAEMGMSKPSFAAVQSASVITLFCEDIAETVDGAWLHALELKRQNIEQSAIPVSLILITFPLSNSMRCSPP